MSLELYTMGDNLLIGNGCKFHMPGKIITLGVLQKYLKSTSRRECSSECDASDQLTIMLGYRYTKKSVM